MALDKALKKLITFENLTGEEMRACMHQIMSNEATSAQIAGFLVALEMKKPTAQELTAAIQVMQAFSKPFSLGNTPLLDIVGTGGDGARTFNISTTCAFVVAAAGGFVAKHGNRSISSTSGSADVLEYAGVNLDQPLESIKACIYTTKIGFLYAPHFHPALKNAAGPRKELGVRTFFNLLGPLTNPAHATYLVVGVFDEKWLLLVAEVLKNLACKQALVVHAEDGLDEISIASPTNIAEIKNNQIQLYHITPEQFGIKRQSIDPIQVNTIAESYQLMREALSNKEGAARDIVLLNAGAALYISSLAENIPAGIKKAQEVLASGKALRKLEELIAFSQSQEHFARRN